MSPGMKVAHVVENLNRGGLERVVIELVLAQREAGHECEVACLFEHGALAGELLDQGIPVHRFGKRIGPDPGTLWRLRGWLRRQQGAVLHSHNAMAHYHMVVAAAGLDFHRVVNTRHGMGGLARHDRRERFFRAAMRRTDYVAAVCEHVRRCLETGQVAPRGGLVVIPNGIRMDRLHRATDASRAALVAELGFAPGTRLVGTVGRLVPVKDHELLLRAFATVAGSDARVALVVAGDGPLRKALEATSRSLGIGTRVRFTGHCADVGRLLAGCNAYVQSSRSEGHSLALLEACAAGLPVVATDVGGNKEIVEHGRNGLLVASGDATGLASALAELLREPARGEAMGEAGRQWALDEASLATMVDRYDALYAGTPSAVQETKARARRVRPHPPAGCVALGGAREAQGQPGGRG